MKKSVLKLIVVLAVVFSCSESHAQTVIPNCTYTPCRAISNLDNKEIWNALANIYVLLSSGGSTVASFKDIQNNDSITARLRRGMLGRTGLGSEYSYLDRINLGVDTINSFLFSGGASEAAWSADNNSKLNSILLYQDPIKRGIDTLNQSDRLAYLKLVNINALLASTLSANITNTVPVTFTNTTFTTIPQSSTLAITATSATASGTITVGCKILMISASSDFSGTLDGFPFSPNGFDNVAAPVGAVLPQRVFTISAGTLYRKEYR